MNIANCPSCLRPGESGFCLKCRKALFGGKRVSPVLSFTRPDYNRRKLEHGDRLSISGVQTKHSLALEGTTLNLTEAGGGYILKPIPSGAFENLSAISANEHITMQIGRQVFGIDTALCAVVFFAGDFAPAYLTKRFDVLPGTRIDQEDFAQIAQLSEENSGRNYKYDYSYEQIAALMNRHVSAYAVEVEKFFRVVLFNHLVHNGDAHVKNFSLFRDPAMGTHRFTPAYDLLNTRLHLPGESLMALDLFDAGYETESHRVNGFFARDDFVEFGSRIGIPQIRVNRFINLATHAGPQIKELLERSFLADILKVRYMKMVEERVDVLGYSYHGKHLESLGGVADNTKTT